MNFWEMPSDPNNLDAHPEDQTFFYSKLINKLYFL